MGRGAPRDDEDCISCWRGIVQDYSCQVVYDELKPQLYCGASGLVGRNPGLKKVFMDILLDLHQGRQ